MHDPTLYKHSPCTCTPYTLPLYPLYERTLFICTHDTSLVQSQPLYTHQAYTSLDTPSLHTLPLVCTHPKHTLANIPSLYFAPQVNRLMLKQRSVRHENVEVDFILEIVFG